jgi:hypothetical protein
VSLCHAILDKLYLADKSKYFLEISPVDLFEADWGKLDPQRDFARDGILWQFKADDDALRADPYLIQLVEEVGLAQSAETRFPRKHWIVTWRDELPYAICRRDVGSELVYQPSQPRVPR